MTAFTRRGMLTATAGLATLALAKSSTPPTTIKEAAMTTTTTAGGWGYADAAAFGDKVSTLPRTALNNAINFFSMQAGMQYAFFVPVTSSFPTTGARYATGATSGTAGATVTLTAYAGTTQGAMTRVAGPVTAPFTTAASLVEVAWGAATAIGAGWLALVFTCTAAGSTPPRLMTPVANNAAGSAFLNPSKGAYTCASRPSTALPTTMDFTTGWNPWALPTWLAAF